MKVVTPLDGTTEFLKHLGDLYRNFGVHLKGQKSIDASLVEAKTCLQNLTTYLKTCVSDVQQQLGTDKVTNGPEGTVSSKTSKSCKLMLNSITQLLKASDVLNPEAKNYCRDFGEGMWESVKRITNWSAKYFTHQRSYYPVPEVAMDLCNVPKLDPTVLCKSNESE